MSANSFGNFPFLEFYKIENFLTKIFTDSYLSFIGKNYFRLSLFKTLYMNICANCDSFALLNHNYLKNVRGHSTYSVFKCNQTT